MQQLQTGFVETNGTKLYYEVMGEGYPLVLIHGGYMDRRMWDDQLAVFAQHYRVILHKSADRLEKDIVGARRFTISGTHHMPNMEKPEEFNRIVLDFLGSL
jgi:pimeloyl-ACP methyl ester carboxylesterase